MHRKVGTEWVFFALCTLSYTRRSRFTGEDGGDGETVCECTHLTNFALILAIDADFDLSEREVLRTLTLVCCGLSCVCLLACVIFFVTHRGSEMTDRIRINANFCANLLVVQVLMLFGIDQVAHPTVCK